MPSIYEKDYYAILDVQPDATPDQIRKAFQKKARTLHPDINKEPDAEERFKEISEAYAVLSDESKRARYDAMKSGSPFAQTSQGYYDFSGFDPFFGSSFSDFAHFQRTVTSPYNPQPGSDIVISFEIDSTVQKIGTKKTFTYKRYVNCTECEGKGTCGHHVAQTCEFCKGSGRMNVNLNDLFGFGVVSMVCPHCQGVGKTVVDPCGACSGSGRLLIVDTVEVDVPKNLHDGEKIRIPAKGNAGSHNNKSGDLVIDISVAHERLTPLQHMGALGLGFLLPFYVLATLASVLSSMIFLLAVPLAVSLFLLLSQTVSIFNRYWLKNVARVMVTGITNGFVIALFMVSLMSCIGRMGSALIM